MDTDEDVLTMPNLDPILSAVVDDTMTVELNAKKAQPFQPPTVDDPRVALLEERLAQVQREELRGVILTGVVLNLHASHLRKRVIECVHKHLLTKHRVLEFLVAQKIVLLSTIKHDLRLLQLEKQEVLDFIDEVLREVKQPDQKKIKSRHSLK
jgi:hypothetical protein